MTMQEKVYMLIAFFAFFLMVIIVTSLRRK